MSRRDLPLLIHLHIPKNAGTTLSRMIKFRFGFWPPNHLLHHRQTLGYYSVPGYRARLDRIARLSEREKRRIRFFEAHIGYGVHHELPRPSAYLTMLRDPIDRTLSVYSYQKQHGRIPDDMSFRDFTLHTDPARVWWIDNAQVRYLACDDGEIVDVPRGECTRDMLEKAKERLVRDFVFFGLVEQFDVSMLLLCQQLGWRDCRYATGNVTRRRVKKQELSESDLALIRDLNELDLELLDFARQRFDAMIASRGPEFPRRLESFIAANRRYNTYVQPIAAAIFRLRHRLRKTSPGR